MKKRIALAAVAALAGGLMVAAPASAVTTGTEAPWTISTPAGTWGTDSTTATVTQVASAGGYVALTAVSNETSTATGGSWVAVSGSTIVGHTETTTNSAATVNTAANLISYAGQAINGNVVKVATTAAGTITVTAGYYVDTNGVITSKTQQTFTITVVAALTTSLYNSSKLTLTKDGAAYADAAGTVYRNSTAGNVAGKITVSQYGDSAQLTKTNEAYTKAVTAEISGVGTLKYNGITAGYIAYAAATANDREIEILADGRAGVGTVTIKVDGVVVGTKSVTFYGAVASYTAVVKNTYIKANGTGVIEVTAKDANGVLVPGATINASEASSYLTSVSAAGVTTTGVSADAYFGIETFTVTAVASTKGAATVTFANHATLSLATVTTTAAVEVVTADIKSVALSFDKAEYAPGEKATLTITVKNSDGSVVGDGAIANLFAAALTSTTSLSGLSDVSVSPTTTAGVKTYTVYMPLAAGPVSVSAVLGAASVVDTTIAGTTISASAKVVAPVDATVTAINAKVASTEATVAALQVTVASVIKSLKVQWWLLKKIAVKVGIKLG